MNQRILLVEDNPTDEKLALRAFRGCAVRHEIVVVRDGAEALDYLFRTGTHAGRTPADDPRVILLDLKLPRIDGLDVLRRIREDERTRLLPVVVLSASREDEDMRRCLSLGANAYLRKPVDFLQFEAAARLLAAFWLDLNEPLPSQRSSA